MKITEALLAEHLVFHNMLDHIETTTPKLKTLPEIKSLATLMESMLKAHSRTEDELFLGPLEHCFEHMGQRDAFLKEHEAMDKSLRRIRRAPRVVEARKALLAAIAETRRHFDQEERIVFPMAGRILKAETLETLGQTWMEQRTNGSVCDNCDNKVCV
jgi:hemerythrin-like domain-containing protein